MKRVLFVCVHNSGRSRMAEGLARNYGKGLIEASSAGTEPADEVDELAIAAMREKGIDISRGKPRALTFEDTEAADLIVTMGCGAEKACPAVAQEKLRDWSLEDPKGKPIDFYRAIRDEIERRVRALIAELS